MTTRAELRVKVSRDLRDPTNTTFSTAEVDDLVNAGIEEVSRVYPREVLEVVAPVAATYSYVIGATQAFRLEVFRSGVFYATLQPNEGEDTQTGWEIWDGSLRLPKHVIDLMVPATDSMRLWGYAPRAQLTTDAQVAQLDDAAEWGVRRYCRAIGFALMHADRAKFKQWQAASQNTDTSNNQLLQMVSLYTSEWDRTRNYLRRLRRV